MMGIKKVVAGSRNRKREKKMNATTNAKTRNVYVREITMPVVFCKDCKYWAEAGREYNPNTNSWSAVMVCDYDECPEGCGHTCWSTDADDFCSRGERAE